MIEPKGLYVMQIDGQEFLKFLGFLIKLFEFYSKKNILCSSLGKLHDIIFKC